MFWICDQSDADNTVIFLLLLNSVNTASRPSLCLTLPPTVSRLEVDKKLGEGHSQDS